MQTEMEMQTEIWTAVRKEGKDDDEKIIFKVENKETQKMRIETRYTVAVPLMLALGGYPEAMGFLMMGQELPWRFRKMGENIYLDGPSIGVDDYHSIDKPDPRSKLSMTELITGDPDGHIRL